MNRQLIFSIGLLFTTAPFAAILTDPVSSVSVSGTSVTLTKDLFGFNNYGLLDGKSDILNNGDMGTWVFDISGLGINFADYDIAVLSARLALDDGTLTPASSYSINIELNGSTAFSGQADALSIGHGSPFGTVFNNWTSIDFNTVPANQLEVNIAHSNLSSAPVWLAIDSLEVELIQSSTSVPAPAAIWLLGSGFIGLVGMRKRSAKLSGKYT